MCIGDGFVVIYIDVLIFTNTIINYCILIITKKFLHIEANTIRIIISSLICSFFSLTVFMKEQVTVISFIIKLVCATVMCLVAFKYISFLSLIKNIVITYIVSIFFCGAMIFIYSTFKPNKMAIINDNIYFNVKPVSLIVISIAVYYLCILIQRLFGENLSNTIVNLKIIIDNNEFSCIGKIDTGCTVTEPFSNSPVIITESSILNTETLRKCNRIIPYNALGISSTIPGIKADQVFIDKCPIDKEIYVGVYQNEIDKTIKAIINSNILR